MATAVGVGGRGIDGAAAHRHPGAAENLHLLWEAGGVEGLELRARGEGCAEGRHRTQLGERAQRVAQHVVARPAAADEERPRGRHPLDERFVDLPLYTWAELMEHNTEEDLWEVGV